MSTVNILFKIALDDQSCWGSGRTLRETALESSAVIKLLEDKFVSSWSLVADLKVGNILLLTILKAYLLALYSY